MNTQALQKRYLQKSNEALLEIISTPANYTKEAIDAAHLVLNSRGGIENVRKVQKQEEVKEKEAWIITSQVKAFLKAGQTEEEIYSKISSTLFDEEKQSELVKQAVEIHFAELEDKKVTNKSLWKGAFGGFIGGTLAGIGWGVSALVSGYYYLIVFFGLISCCTLFVVSFSGKSKLNKGNIIIIILTVLYALLIGQLVLEIFCC